MNDPIQILHLSDLHFGRITDAVLASLKQFIEERKSGLHLLILTGDLTQRARTKEFQAARRFLEELPIKVFLVPGNHDIPLYNLFQRFLSPYRKFCQHLGPYSSRSYEDEYVVLFGLWTTNNFTVKNSHIKSRELYQAKTFIREAPRQKLKIIASHHPLSGPEMKFQNQVGELIESGVHIFLSGHEHQSHVREIYPGAYSISSGTATSNRTRSEVNSFNLITLHQGKAEIEIFHHEAQGFRSSSRQSLSLA